MKKFSVKITAMAVSFMLLACACSGPGTGDSSGVDSTGVSGSPSSQAGLSSSPESGPGSASGSNSTPGSSEGTESTTSGNSHTSNPGTTSTVKPNDTGNINPSVPDNTKYDTSGQIKNLKGRTIKMASGTIQTAPGGSANSDDRLLANLRKSVETKLNCKLESVNVTFEQMQTSILAGDPAADIWVLNTLPDFVNAYKAKLIQPIEPLKCMNLADRTRYSSLTDLTYINGNHYGFAPQTYGAWRVALNRVLYINKSLLSSKGITASEIYKAQEDGTWTWSKFREICKKVNTPASGIYAINDANSALYMDLLASNQVSYVKMENGKLSFNGSDKKAQEVMTYYQQLVADGSLKVDYDPNKGGIDIGHGGIDQYQNNYDLNLFKEGKTAFLSAPSYLANANLFGEQMKNVGVTYCPKPDGAAQYSSFLDHACIIAIPTYSDKDPAVAQRKAAETATVIEALFAPYKSQSQYDAQLQREVAAFANDSNWMKVYSTLYDRTYLSYTGIAGEVVRADKGSSSKGWLDYIPLIAKGSVSYSSAINGETSRYNNILKNIFTFNK